MVVWRRKARFAVARPRLGCRAGRGRVGRGSREISNSSRVQGRTGPDRPGTGQGCCGLVALAFSEVQALWQATQRQRVFTFQVSFGMEARLSNNLLLFLTNSRTKDLYLIKSQFIVPVYSTSGLVCGSVQGCQQQLISCQQQQRRRRMCWFKVVFVGTLRCGA